MAREILGKLEGQEFEDAARIVAEYQALQSGSVSGVTLEQATFIVERHDELWKGMRRDPELNLDDRYSYYLCRETGCICEIPDE